MTKGHWLPLALAPAPLCGQHCSIAAAARPPSVVAEGCSLLLSLCQCHINDD